jgi:HrpA-like RNA helicase
MPGEPRGPQSVEENQKNLFSHGLVFNPDLPIFEQHDKIVSTIAQFPTVLVHGATGCGKTTQIPQYILDDCLRNVSYHF